MMTSRLGAAMTALALIAFTGCAEGTDTETGEMSDTVGMTETEPMTEPTPDEAVTADLEAKNESGVTGTVELTPDAGTIAILVELDGAGQGTYTAHLYEGACDDERASIEKGRVVTIGTIDAAAGAATATTTIDRAQLDPAAEGWFVEIHDADDAVVSCAGVDLPEPAGEAGGTEPGTAEEGPTTEL